MANYNYEEQGDNRFLVYEMAEEDQIDTVSIGQLTDSANTIEGILPVMQMEVDNKQIFRVNVSGMKSLTEYFIDPVKPYKLLQIMTQLSGILMDAEDYMLSYTAFLLDPQYVFINPSTDKVSIVSLPVIHKSTAPKDFLKDLLFQQYDTTEDMKTIPELMAFFRENENFSVAQLHEKTAAMLENKKQPVKKQPEPAPFIIEEEPEIPQTEVNAAEEKPQEEPKQREEHIERNTEEEKPAAPAQPRRVSRPIAPASDRPQTSEVRSARSARAMDIPAPAREQKKEEQPEEKQEEEKKSFFGSLFGSKKDKPEKKKKEKPEKKESKKKEPADSGMNFAIPGRDAANLHRSADDIPVRKTDIPAAGRRQETEVPVSRRQETEAPAKRRQETEAPAKRKQEAETKEVYRAPQNDVDPFDTTMADEDDFDSTMADETMTEFDAPVIQLKLEDSCGYDVPDMITLQLIDGYATIGRYDKTGKPCADFNFDYSLTFISRNHVKFVIGAEGIEIIDTESTNGTLLNGQLLESKIPYLVESGDRIMFSKKTRITYTFV